MPCAQALQAVTLVDMARVPSCTHHVVTKISVPQEGETYAGHE